MGRNREECGFEFSTLASGGNGRIMRSGKALTAARWRYNERIFRRPGRHLRDLGVAR